MLDWDALVHAPIMSTHGNVRADYSIGGAPAIKVDGILDEGARPIQIVTGPDVNEVVPTLGIRLAQFPPDFNPRNAKGDTFVANGITYNVKDGRPDSHGWAILEATRA
jgi:hypothetical protein